MKFVGFSVLVSENKIISGEVRKDIYWSFYWYMHKFVHHFSDKLMVLLRYLFFSVIVWISGRSFQMMAEPLMIKYAACRVSLIVLISMNYFYPHGIWARICISSIKTRVLAHFSIPRKSQASRHSERFNSSERFKIANVSPSFPIIYHPSIHNS